MAFLDLKSLEKLPLDKQITVKKYIINHNELETIPVVYLPDVHATDYYFVSYSHKDYKEVYNDIFDLEQAGLSIWYDRGIPAGINWKDSAVKYLTPFDCKGVLFYISENALVSKAIADEIEFTLKANKPFIVIFINKGNEKSPLELINRLFKEGKIDKNRYEFYKKTFPEEVIYLSYETSALTKVEKIKSSIVEQPLLDIDRDTLLRSIEVSEVTKQMEPWITLFGVNNYYATSIKMSDYAQAIIKSNIDKSEELLKECCSHLDDSDIIINEAAFSNCKNLEYIEIPSGRPINIGAFAFNRCEMLTEVRFINGQEGLIALDRGAFMNCRSLKSFDFKNVEISDECFAGCQSLRDVDLTNSFNCHDLPNKLFLGCRSLTNVMLPDKLCSIGIAAFSRCNIKSITLPSSLKTIERRAFLSCKNLESVEFNKSLLEIAPLAFYSTGLKSINLPKSLTKIYNEAFSRCPSLTKISYEGTYEELLKIVDEDWLGEEHDEIVLKCADQTVVVPKKEKRI